MKTATLTVDVRYDESVTDPDSLATAMDRLVATAMSIPGVLDEYANPVVGAFLVTQEPHAVTPIKHPLPIDEIRRQAAAHEGRVKAVIEMDLMELIACGEEELEDDVEDRILGEGPIFLLSPTFRVVGHRPIEEGSEGARAGGYVLVEVTGEVYISELLDGDDE